MPAFPRVSYTTEEIGQLTTLNIDLSSYTSQAGTRWVVEGGVQEEWETYMDTLNQMGLENFLGIMDAAYQRYEESAQ